MRSGRAALLLLLAGLTLGAFGAPFAADAQQPGKVYRIGYLSPRPGIDYNTEGFRKALGQLGYVEGQNLVIAWRFSRGRMDVFSGLADELVRLNLDCIVAIGVPAVAALKKSTATTPIVIGAIDADPVDEGLVASFARPGANITGITSISYDLAGKRLELLKETVPGLARVAILIDPSRAADAHVREAAATGGTLGLEIRIVEARSPGELESTFRIARQGRTQALYVVATGLMNSHRAQIVKLAAATQLPTIYSHRDFVREGGLMSYADHPIARAHRAAAYVDLILKGATPADLPIERPTKFELVINLKTARALGLTIPPSLLLRADQVME
jgi:putative ABC transport system substrate-binding protein